MNVTTYSVDLVKDPFGILSGKRYEFKLDLEVPEDDELYTEQGVYVRAIFVVDGEESRIAKYDFYENTGHQYLDFDMEPEEVEILEAFCREHIPAE